MGPLSRFADFLSSHPDSDPGDLPVQVHALRRKRLAEQMRQRGGGVAVLATAPEVIRNRDAHYPYRSDSYFHYLTGFPEPEAVLVMVVDAQEERSILFCRDKNEEREIWDGFRFGPAAARERFGIDEACSISELDARMASLLANQPTLFHPLGARPETDAAAQRWLAAVRAQARAGVSAPHAAFDLHGLLDEMRLLKDDHELQIMQRAGTISAQAHRRAMQTCQPGLTEYQVEAELLYEFHRHGSTSPAYGSIVAGGANACVLHYRDNRARLRDGDLLLIDAGCELEGYASDITRTFPVNGRFSSPQRALYDIVLAAQSAAIEATRPGMRFTDPHDAATRVLAQGMIDCGLVQGSLDGVLESGSYRRFYMHRTSHWLGMDVHDCGEYREPGEPAEGPEKPWRILRPGMVLTIEPGLYVRAADDLPRAFHDIGIRIEDDAVVTPEGCQLLTREVPVSADEIEALMRESPQRS
jgi:Xaa-Pro aminopeptidase